MPRISHADSRKRKVNTETDAFLTSLNRGPLTFGQVLSAIRKSDQGNAADFAGKLGISRQHLHQLESGSKRVSTVRAVRFSRVLGQSQTLFLQLALQDLANDSGVSASVVLKVA